MASCLGKNKEKEIINILMSWNTQMMNAAIAKQHKFQNKATKNYNMSAALHEYVP